MLQSKIWGPITWNMLHTIIDKCQMNEEFESYKYKLIHIIKHLCLFVPCNESSYNSNIFFEKFSLDKIRNLNELKKYIYMLHNFINTKLHKPLFNYSDLTRYSNMDINNVFNTFVYLYSSNIHLKNIQTYPRIISLIKDIKGFLNLYIIPYYTKNIIEKEEEVIIPKEEEVIIPKEEEVIIPKEEEVIIPKEEAAPRLINKNLIIRTNKKTFNDRNIHNNISIIDDKFLPSIELNLSEAILEMKKNINCTPLDAYIERWNRAKNFKNISKIQKKPVIVDDKLLPELSLSLPIAIHKIKNSPKCVPFDLYIKRWNELKTTQTYNKKHVIKNTL
jgi:hypothetical protein